MNKPNKSPRLYSLSASQKEVIASMTNSAKNRYSLLSSWDKNKIIFPKDEVDIKTARLKTEDLLKYDFADYLIGESPSLLETPSDSSLRVIDYLVDLVDWDSIIDNLFSSVTFNEIELIYNDHKRTGWGFLEDDLFILNAEMSENKEARIENHVPIPGNYVIGYSESSQQLLSIYLMATHPIGLIKSLIDNDQTYSEHDPIDFSNLILKIKSKVHRKEWETCQLQKEPIGFTKELSL